MVTIYLNNQQTKIEIELNLEDILHRVVTALLEQENKNGPGELSITLVDNENIRELNRVFRFQDKATDVLSFPADDVWSQLDPDAPRIWGDVVVSVEQAADQALAYGHSLCRELCFLVAHGVLHLLGYDHEEPEESEHMEARGEQVLASLGIGRENTC